MGVYGAGGAGAAVHELLRDDREPLLRRNEVGVYELQEARDSHTTPKQARRGSPSSSCYHLAPVAPGQ